jgi:hypothetical protein
LEFYASVHSFLDCNTPVDIVFLDFVKAFDRVNHELLLHKLTKYGVVGPIARWIKSWLSNRVHKVVVRGCPSTEHLVTSGTIQGSVLGPLLFQLFIDDFGEGAASKNNKFADDSKFSCGLISADSTFHLQLDLTILYNWCEEWLLYINPRKTEVLHLGRANALNNYFWGVNKLVACHVHKDLGVTIDPDLDFSQHVSIVVKKATGLAMMISRSITSRSPGVYFKLFLSLVRPILEYAVELWWPYLCKHMIALENVQRRFTKRILNFSDLSYTERLRRLNTPSIYWRYIRGALICAFKIIRLNYGGPRVAENFTLLNSTRTRGHQWKLARTRVNHVKTKNFFFHKTVPLWNGLPATVVSASSVNAFKNQLDKFISDETEYTFAYL